MILTMSHALRHHDPDFALATMLKPVGMAAQVSEVQGGEED